MFMNVSASVKFGYVVLATSYWLMADTMLVRMGAMTAYKPNHKKAITNNDTITTAETYRVRVGCGLIVGRLNASSFSFSVSLIVLAL